MEGFRDQINAVKELLLKAPERPIRPTPLVFDQFHRYTVDEEIELLQNTCIKLNAYKIELSKYEKEVIATENHNNLCDIKIKNLIALQSGILGRDYKPTDIKRIINKALETCQTRMAAGLHIHTFEEAVVNEVIDLLEIANL